MLRSGLVFMLLAGILLISCLNDREKPIDPDAIYFDYMVTGNEETGLITTKLQCRLGRRDGDPLLLVSPAGISMDSIPVLPDSTAFNGVYYEVISDADTFEGQHTIEFTDAAGVKYPASFWFPVFTLKDSLPGIVERKGLVLELSGLKEDDVVRIILTDTSFYGKGVERVDSVKTGRIVITEQELENIHNGPVHLEVIREEDIRINPGEQKRGRLYLYYSLQREFILQDSVGNSAP